MEKWRRARVLEDEEEAGYYLRNAEKNIRFCEISRKIIEEKHVGK